MLPRTLLPIVGRLWLIVLLANHCTGARKWTYQPLSIETYSTDDNLLKISAKVDRIGRGDYGISAEIEFKYDVDETTMVEAVAYRSSSGEENDYKIIPLSIPKQNYIEFMNSNYKDVVIPNLSGCSNLITFEDKFEPPFPKDTYKLDKCVADSDGFPDIVPEGYYKVNFTMSGQVDWGFIIIVKISNKLM
ncbi:uncharacterized protein LOC108029979 [Drosophila biarmipes]|uniref:uncharacterized protein LOC108029979 n=1 Tax=Drosophila biarmipes TaxID=125945 RepID=UPI0007E7BDB2|nr:uncharacterized protein LOC108029979 [Drosophila biarmipes]